MILLVIDYLGCELWHENIVDQNLVCLALIRGRFFPLQIATDGFIAFAPPPHGTSNSPVFPNPKYPKERDHPFIAPFYSKTAFTSRSRVFYRHISRGQAAKVGATGDQLKQFHENDL